MISTNINFSIYDELIRNLKNLISKKRPIILAIDGMCGSGKTTLAQYLTSIFDASVIHMDNFFLPFERKTLQRLSEPGGNIDYERFIDIILPALKQNETFAYTAYNCQTRSYDRTVEVCDCELIVIEGSYSLHEKFGIYYDYSLFLTVSDFQQLERLETRCNDNKKFSLFKTKWIPMESHYHQKQNVLRRCNLIIDTTIK